MATCMFLPTEHIFLCHETDASYAYPMAWHMKYEIIHGCRPSIIVPEDFLVWRKLVPLHFLEVIPGANQSLRTHQKFCSKASRLDRW